MTEFSFLGEQLIRLLRCVRVWLNLNLGGKRPSRFWAGQQSVFLLHLFPYTVVEIGRQGESGEQGGNMTWAAGPYSNPCLLWAPLLNMSKHWQWTHRHHANASIGNAGNALDYTKLLDACQDITRFYFTWSSFDKLVLPSIKICTNVSFEQNCFPWAMHTQC